jgi:hypothetical protein
MCFYCPTPEKKQNESPQTSAMPHSDGNPTAHFTPYQHWLLSACCPLDVRLLSALKADNKRTSSGQQADNNQS